MTVKQSLAKLQALNACGDARDWVNHSGAKTPQEVWNKCDRGDWMLWLLGKLSGNPESAKRKKLVKATCGCARLALKFIKTGENRPRICIETTEAWVDGKATIEQVRQARCDAAAYAAYAAYAADAAAYAADAADASAASAAAAYAAAYAAAAAYADAAYARKLMLKDCADVVRKFFPKAPKL